MRARRGDGEECVAAMRSSHRTRHERGLGAKDDVVATLGFNVEAVSHRRGCCEGPAVEHQHDQPAPHETDEGVEDTTIVGWSKPEG